MINLMRTNHWWNKVNNQGMLNQLRLLQQFKVDNQAMDNLQLKDMADNNQFTNEIIIKLIQLKN